MIATNFKTIGFCVMSCEIPCDWLSVKSEEVYKSLADDPDLFGLGWQANDLTDRLQSLDTAAKASAEILRHRKPKVEVCSAKEEIELSLIHI